MNLCSGLYECMEDFVMVILCNVHRYTNAHEIDGSVSVDRKFEVFML